MPSRASARASEYVATRRFSSTVSYGQQPTSLGDDRDATRADVSGRRRVDVLVVEHHAACHSVRSTAGDGKDESRFAGAVRAEQRGHLTRRDLEGDVGDERDARRGRRETPSMRSGAVRRRSQVVLGAEVGAHHVSRRRSTSAVGPEAISLPKSSTAVVSQQAETRLMSWSTRITSAP